jgi:peptidoglycan/LPS O-acetylase OafA/YrhL
MSEVKHRLFLSENSSVCMNLIRTIASQMVIIGHGISFLNIAQCLSFPNMPYMQNIAVVIFFIMSGFLISFNVYKKKENDNYNFRVYLIERFSRLYIALLPVLFLIIIFDCILILLGNHYYLNNFNFETFLSNLFMLQDSYKFNILLFGNSSFGSARPLWTLALLWWLYLFFGWIILKKKSNKNMILQISLCIVFFFMLSSITLGNRSHIKYRLLIAWFIGYITTIFLYESQNKNLESNLNSIIYPGIILISISVIAVSIISFDFTISVLALLIICFGFFFILILSFSQNKEEKPKILLFLVKITLKIKNSVINRVKWSVKNPKRAFFFLILTVILASYRILLTKDAYELVFIILLSTGFFFLVCFLNQSNFKFPEKIKKLAKFGSSYSFVLYCIHYSIFSIIIYFQDDISPIILFFIAYFISNLLSISIAYFTEMKHYSLRKFLIRKFNLQLKNTLNKKQQKKNIKL